MRDFNSLSIDTGITNQLTDDLRRMLAGVNIRLDNSEITGGDLQEQIKALLGNGSYYEPEPIDASGTPVPVKDVVGNSKTTVEQRRDQSYAEKKGNDSSRGSESGAEASRNAAHHDDMTMPESLQSLTGTKSVGEFVGNSMSSVLLGGLMAMNPVAGMVGTGVLNVLKGAEPLDALADIFVGMNPLTSLGSTVMDAVGMYSKAEGTVTSIADSYKTFTSDSYIPTTLAGRNVINSQVESEKEKTGTYDSSRSSQTRASTAALNRDSAPAYARPGYGTSLADAPNPAAKTAKAAADATVKSTQVQAKVAKDKADAEKVAKANAEKAKTSAREAASYRSSGGIGATKEGLGHAAAGGVGPSPSKPTAAGKSTEGKSANDSSKGNSSSSKGGPSALGGSSSYGGAMSGGYNGGSNSSNSGGKSSGSSGSSSGGKSSSGGSNSSNGKSGSGSYGGR